MSGKELTVLVLPGYQNSAAGHWQTCWESLDPIRLSHSPLIASAV